MQIKFFAQNMKLSPRAETLIRERIERIIKLSGGKVKDFRDIRVDLSRKPGHASSEEVRMEININLYPGQIILRAHERGPDFRTVMDRVEKILKREMAKYKGRAKARALRGARYAKHIGGAAEEAFEEGRPRFGKRRREE